MDFTTAAQLLALCQEGSVTLGEAMLRREMALTGASRGFNSLSTELLVTITLREDGETPAQVQVLQALS